MRLAVLAFTLLSASVALAQTTDMAVRGLCIAAPQSGRVDRFVKFIHEELEPMQVNTLVLRVDWNYMYESHPELRGSHPLTQQEVKSLVAACQRVGINLIPQINLLGHQSWHSSVGKLLEAYPHFDETPNIQLPAEYRWPNDDGLYCKSYCPLHPEVHAVVFALVDELMNAFEATDFHAGLDEVFYLAHDDCTRCKARDPAVLFAGEVTRISNHLAAAGRRLWLWGDRLLDGIATGMGLWEASLNQTHRAIDWIPRNVVICDWHYERAEPSYAYFAMKDFDVVTCPWDKPEVALKQLDDYRRFQTHSNPALAGRYKGMMQTVWSGAEAFLDAYYDPEGAANERVRGSVACFRALFEAIAKDP